MNQPQRIFIIGHHGAGKGLLAKSVAQSLGWQFVDADLGLESHVGRHLSEILGNPGCDAFYECQFNILTSLCTQEHIVVTTDSTIVLSLKNRQLLRNEMTVFLDVSTPVQIDRTSRNTANLLPIPSLTDFFDQLHDERDSLYKEVASLTIHGDDGKLEEHTRCIVKTILGNEKMLPKKILKSILEKKDFTLYHKKFHTKVELSEHQALYLKLLAQGKTAKEIAREAHVSYRTVEGIIAKLMESLGCSSSKELIALYHEQP
ncbi:TPA: shikimate kinase [Legionella pneumophila]|jgi:shikimate kinase|uniref:shikimate kinase n=1 Tax=Legionella pneumophila TaxID=446 RepID=UPI00077CC0E7|nr:shikimate kinase [Legionella pneumophila]AMQ28338.1 shikimate kinase [Legionella pneumophila subsp. pneumophila]MBN5929565.1 shikimate kinase [Legionella pneumophila]MDW8967268.1 shikimate kinase [Legionella pneumophila]MDW9135177.1 shikimate kinase [Legionella pneumophila]MDW9141398.1 shikimate kinase [Legionella pneumophila]